MNLEEAAGLFCICAVALHIASTALAIRRCGRRARVADAAPKPPVTVLRPLRGVDPFDELTLTSGFKLSYPDYELILCCADANDPAAGLARRLIAAHPRTRARLLTGENGTTGNPKLDNLLKGWNASTRDWVLIADCNVLMPPGYIERVLSAWRQDTGLVCAPPIGGMARGLWAEVECAFLNTYQARWQYTADTVGLGFAQGKSMLFHRPHFDNVGGIAALGREIAEDAAATKVVRDMGFRVRLVDQPFPQPLGRRSAGQVWSRQLRWARLRRVTFPLFFLPEIVTSSVFAIASGAFAADLAGVEPLAGAGAVASIWFGCEALLARLAGWQLTILSPLAWIVRDLTLPVLWLQAWAGNSFNWRGNDMRVAGVRS